MKTCLILVISLVLATTNTAQITDRDMPPTHEYTLLGYLDNKNSQEIIKTISEVQSALKSNIVNYFFTNCSLPNHNTLKQCERKSVGDSVVRLWRHGRQLYEFTYRGAMKTNQIADWVKRIINKVPARIQSVDDLKQIVEEKRFVFVFFDIKKEGDIDAYTFLAKKYNQYTFGVVHDPEVREQLGQGQRNFTVYKYPFDLKNRQNEPSERKSFQGWQAFVISRAYPEMNPEDHNHIIDLRYRQGDVEFAALECDDTYQCTYDIVPKFYQYYLERIKNEVPFQIRFHHMLLRQNHMIRLYYHLKGENYPILGYVKLKSKNFFVHTQPLSSDSSLSEQFDNMIQKAQQNGLQETRVSQQVPPNNGIGLGKGTSKLIQHLVYDTIDQTLKDNPNKWYLVLFTLLGSGCDRCEEFYKQFRKAASFVQGEDWSSDLVFARYDAIKNTIQCSAVGKIPQVVLFKPLQSDKTQRQAIKMKEYHDFNGLMKFINQNLVDNKENDQQVAKAEVIQNFEPIKKPNIQRPAEPVDQVVNVGVQNEL